MATTGKTKRKAKAKRRKTSRRATARSKTKTVGKVGNKPPRRVRKTKAAVRAAVKPTPARPPLKTPVATPTPSMPVRPAAPEQRIGVVTHYFSHLSVATIRLESGRLHVGDVIHIHGHTTDFRQKVESLEVNHVAATEVGPSDDFGLKVAEHVREHDVVYRVRS